MCLSFSLEVQSITSRGNQFLFYMRQRLYILQKVNGHMVVLQKYYTNNLLLLSCEVEQILNILKNWMNT